MSEDQLFADLPWRKVTGISVDKSVYVKQVDNRILISIRTDIDISVEPDGPDLPMADGEWAAIVQAVQSSDGVDPLDFSAESEPRSAVPGNSEPGSSAGSDNLNGYQLFRWLIRLWLSRRQARKGLKGLVAFLSLWALILAFATLLICVLVAWAAAWSGTPESYLFGVLAGLTGLLGVFFKTRK